MIIPHFIPKDNIEEYLYNNFNLEIYNSLEEYEGLEEGLNRLVLFNKLYEQYDIVLANKSKPNSIVTHLLKLDLPDGQLYLLLVFLVLLIEVGHEEATDDIQDNSMHICKALILKEANKIHMRLPTRVLNLDAPEIRMIEEGHHWMERELEKLPDYKSKMVFLIKAKAEYLRKEKLIIQGSPPDEVPPNEVYDIEMNKLKSLEELNASVSFSVKPEVKAPNENTRVDNVSNNTTQDVSLHASPFPDPKLNQTRKYIEAEFDRIHKSQGWQYAFNYESEYNTFVELLVKFFEGQPYEIPEKILRLKNNTKVRVARVLRNLHRDLKFDDLKLKEDKDFFRIINVLNHFEKYDDTSVYFAITK